MTLLLAFFRLIRWQNLLFIALTQCLFFYAVFNAVLYPNSELQNSGFFLLVAASLFIAAAGYIINDYFDRQIDAVNKPGKVVVDNLVKRRWAIIFHLVFSLTGILISIYISLMSGNWLIAFGNIICVLLLWFYSTTFKKKLLIGNIIISALTAWVILVIYFYYTGGLNTSHIYGWNKNNFHFDVRRFFKFTILYAGFAFILSLIREVVKDLEDIQGDAKYQCKTMPIVWGVPATKVFTAVWIVVSIAALLIVVVYGWQSGWWLASLFCAVFIIFPLVFVLKRLSKAVTRDQYHYISTVIKFIMLAGILSMIFFKIL